METLPEHDSSFESQASPAEATPLHKAADEFEKVVTSFEQGHQFKLLIGPDGTLHASSSASSNLQQINRYMEDLVASGPPKSLDDNIQLERIFTSFQTLVKKVSESKKKTAIARLIQNVIEAVKTPFGLSKDKIVNQSKDQLEKFTAYKHTLDAQMRFKVEGFPNHSSAVKIPKNSVSSKMMSQLQQKTNVEPRRIKGTDILVLPNFVNENEPFDIIFSGRKLSGNGDSRIYEFYKLFNEEALKNKIPKNQIPNMFLNFQKVMLQNTFQDQLDADILNTKYKRENYTIEVVKPSKPTINLEFRDGEAHFQFQALYSLKGGESPDGSGYFFAQRDISCPLPLSKTVEDWSHSPPEVKISDSYSSIFYSRDQREEIMSSFLSVAPPGLSKGKASSLYKAITVLDVIKDYTPDKLVLKEGKISNEKRKAGEIPVADDVLAFIQKTNKELIDELKGIFSPPSNLAPYENTPLINDLKALKKTQEETIKKLNKNMAEEHVDLSREAYQKLIDEINENMKLIDSLTQLTPEKMLEYYKNSEFTADPNAQVVAKVVQERVLNEGQKSLQKELSLAAESSLAPMFGNQVENSEPIVEEVSYLLKKQYSIDLLTNDDGVKLPLFAQFIKDLARDQYSIDGRLISPSGGKGLNVQFNAVVTFMNKLGPIGFYNFQKMASQGALAQNFLHIRDMVGDEFFLKDSDSPLLYEFKEHQDHVEIIINSDFIVYDKGMRVPIRYIAFNKVITMKKEDFNTDWSKESRPPVFEVVDSYSKALPTLAEAKQDLSRVLSK